MSKATQGALFLLAILFLGLGGYYLFVAPEPSTPSATDPSTTLVDDAGMDAGQPDGVVVEAIDLTNLDEPVSTIGMGTMPPDSVFDSPPRAGNPVDGATVVDVAVAAPVTSTAQPTASPTAGTAPVRSDVPPAVAPVAIQPTPGPASAPATIPAAPASQSYVVKSGDTLTSIAQNFYGPKGKWETIAAANPGINPNKLKVNSTITIPHMDGASSLSSPGTATATPSTDSYTVVGGDTLSGISQKVYGSQKHWRAIYEANKSAIGSDPADLKVGMKLKIPAKP